MYGVVTQRSSPGFYVAYFSDGSLDYSLCSSKVLAKSLRSYKRSDLRCSRKGRLGNSIQIAVRADAATSGTGRYVAPLQPESPTGQFLIELLRSHPHLVSVAAEQQLDKLTEDRVAMEGQEHANSDSILYKRIAELKAQERRTTVEEIMYVLVTHRFLEAHISMVPMIPLPAENQRVDNWDNWPAHERELLAVHSIEAVEMVWEHLAFILGVKGATESLDESILVEISRLHIGQVYATSALYGYFLRRVDEKFQMEKTLSPSARRSDENKCRGSDARRCEDDTFAADMLATISAVFGLDGLKQDAGLLSSGDSTNLLRDYVLSFEVDTLYRCATIRSIESACIIERHTEALFGKPEEVDDPSGKEVNMLISLAGLKRLVLEAVAFGSFLWDAETLIDSRYSIVK